MIEEDEDDEGMSSATAGVYARGVDLDDSPRLTRPVGDMSRAWLVFGCTWRACLT